MAKRRTGSKFLPAKHTPPPGWRSPLASEQPLTTARWLAGAAAVTLLLAALCVYITFCLIFWQGQWQLVFQPSRAITATPASAGLAYQEVRFDATEEGVLQLNGWWIPAATSSNGTLMFLRDGSGSLSANTSQLAALHQLGMNVFAFDYRGFGKSVTLHPSETSTEEDADAAWRYLTETRHVAGDQIVLDGVGLGAAVAVEVARRHPEARAVILERLRPPVLETLQFDRQTRLLPIRLLFHDRFDPRATLAHLVVPKLFLDSGAAATQHYYDDAAEPKEKARCGPENGEAYVACLQMFLRSYAKQP